jgi:hypothetical protein
MSEKDASSSKVNMCTPIGSSYATVNDNVSVQLRVIISFVILSYSNN